MDDERETFLLSIPDAINSSEYSSSSDDSDIEVASTFDEQENELIKISNELRLDSDSDESADDNATVLPQSMTSTHFDVDVHSSEDDEIPVDGAMVDNASSITSNNDTNAIGRVSRKRKRRAWSVKEKLMAVGHYEKSKSKHSTAKTVGCTRFQLSQWIKNREELRNLQATEKGYRLICDLLIAFCNIR